MCSDIWKHPRLLLVLQHAYLLFLERAAVHYGSVVANYFSSLRTASASTARKYELREHESSLLSSCLEILLMLCRYSVSDTWKLVGSWHSWFFANNQTRTLNICLHASFRFLQRPFYFFFHWIVISRSTLLRHRLIGMVVPKCYVPRRNFLSFLSVACGVLLLSFVTENVYVCPVCVFLVKLSMTCLLCQCNY